MVAELEITFEPATMHSTAPVEQASGTIRIGPPTEIAEIFVVEDARACTTMVMV